MYTLTDNYGGHCRFDVCTGLRDLGGANPPPLILLYITSRFAYMKQRFCFKLILIFCTLLEIRSSDKLSIELNVLLPYSSY